MLIIQLITYASVLIAIAAMIIKAFRYLKAPMHFRWELYPVPHEKGRAEYGGSFLEELNWWTKPRHSDKLNELKEMMQEVLLLKGVFLHNRSVWTFSLPFHFGLYLCIAWLLLLLGSSIIEMVGVAVTAEAGVIGVIVYYMTIILGYAGLTLTGLGAFGLMIWRASSKAQRVYNSPVEYINLILFVIVVVVALISHLISDPTFSVLRGYVSSLITFSESTSLGSWLIVEVILVSLLIMYIPLTRMSHFVAKYFLYHSVRWNDEPNLRGSKIEKRLLALLQRKVGWSADHIQTGKSWAEVVKEMKDE